MTKSKTRSIFNDVAVAVSPDLRNLLQDRKDLAREKARLTYENTILRADAERLNLQADQFHANLDKLSQALLDLSSGGGTKAEQLRKTLEAAQRYIDQNPINLQFKQLFFEFNGTVAAAGSVAGARAWPLSDDGVTYRDKLLGLLPISDGIGVELGPLNLPLVPKDGTKVIYLDHVDTDGLQAKYSYLEGIAPVDLAIVDNDLQKTLKDVAPLDYFVGSQVMEHVGNPIKWLSEIASVMRMGGRVALSLPDRRMTFDFLRQESRASDMVAAYLNGAGAPDLRSVYDHHSMASLINMGWASDKSVTPAEVLQGGGATKVHLASQDHLALLEKAKQGEYLDVHAWVFTPPTFLMAMAQLAGDGFLRMKMCQFYPTVLHATDRSNASFTVVLEKCADTTSPEEIRRSFLAALWPE